MIADWFGSTLWLPALLVAVPMVTAGILLRRSGKSGVALWAEADQARRDVRNLEPGLVTVSGRWREGGFVDGEGGSVKVVGGSATAGEAVVVHGVVTHDEPDQSGYRESARVWVVDITGTGGFVSADLGVLKRRRRAARLRATFGVALFAFGVATAVLGGVLARRADTGDLYSPAE